jgi:serine/threonine-protein kinase
MGEVFAAENLRTGRQVAVKLLRSESKLKSSAIERFRREARAAGSIQSDYVTQILDVDEDPEHGIVLVFELLEGESLVERLKRTGPIPFDELHPMVDQIWMGLVAAHRAGIIHRDLKPSNVFLERRPDGGVRVKLLDFGISKLPREMGGETLTELGQSLGTFSFMPPEQIGKAKTVDHRADIYSCASLIYQALSGQLPYAAKNILMMVELKTKQEPRRLSVTMDGPVDPRLDEFLSISLSRDPEQRFQTADDALAAWRDLAGAPAGRALVSSASTAGRKDVAPAAFMASSGGQSMHGAAPKIGERHQTPGFGMQSSRPSAVSVPRVHAPASDSWDDSHGSAESGREGEDAATLAIHRDQVGQAIRQYGSGGGLRPQLLPPQQPMGNNPTTEDDLRTNQGTVMMMKTPLAPGQSMHRHGSPRASGSGMMAPALMPPMQHPQGPGQGLQGHQSQPGQGQSGQGQSGQGQSGQGQPGQGHQGHQSQPGQSQAGHGHGQQPGALTDSGSQLAHSGPKSNTAFIIGAVVLAIASFAVIAIVLSFLGPR